MTPKCHEPFRAMRMLPTLQDGSTMPSTIGVGLG
jgi:hypothetical protein